MVTRRFTRFFDAIEAPKVNGKQSPNNEILNQLILIHSSALSSDPETASLLTDSLDFLQPKYRAENGAKFEIQNRRVELFLRRMLFSGTSAAC